jgi:hypothetical protein
MTETEDNAIDDKLDVVGLADHLIHEHMHRIGFLHNYHKSKERCDSIPYAYGRTVCQFTTDKYHKTGRCDQPVDWPPEQPSSHNPPHGPSC